MIHWHKIIPSVSFVRNTAKKQHLPWQYWIRLFSKICHFICRSLQCQHLDHAPVHLVSASYWNEALVVWSKKTFSAFLEQNFCHNLTSKRYKLEMAKTYLPSSPSPTSSEISQRAVSAFLTIEQTRRKRLCSGWTGLFALIKSLAMITKTSHKLLGRLHALNTKPPVLE